MRLVIDSREFSGWTLNISRGGARILLLDAELEVAETGELTFEGPDEQKRPARVVWVHAEADGLIVGVQFLDTEGSVPPPDP